ncbi:MAG TPA: bifunctional 2-C-methyl-D-erythritol 4-phosphate cytidylyltransferase/2-C-methyl-D-erythritol 2,4-cyclodiphosphate synthase [Dongiaceae bacterium]|jgi:2-C-methyl-D-erythritol 4-phosphate cytidylyltransferase/2-C-methyl-D-erythritol 2,4-cyclodiphosphate synthase|nr:bifunctional 2-C-methyl-D-erythritol 4-phosphate cytidylyltransferase/2-C-methyl-D-erythritol 2,4-cyclodiphosphate synthase [Dongiaceae bacterium]
MSSPRTFVLVVAAGSGQRFGGDLPKQYQALAGKPMLRHSLETFATHPGIAGTLVAIHPAQHDLYDAASAGIAKLLPPVEGGTTRQGSVLNGLERLVAERPDYVLIHDAARPLIDAGTIGRTIEALGRHPAILVAVPVVDTIKRGVGERVGDTVDRRDLWRAQTPQAFHFQAILEAHRKVAGGALTDDAAVAEAAGIPVTFVMGSERNFKVTTQDDMERAERMIGSQMEFRTGNGFDVHRIVAGDGITMCGVRIPCDMALEGHSDADVGLHAITDAVLGAIGAKDIGAHFPPSDPKWRGAESWRFLDHAAKLVAERGGRVAHCDVTIICERPKVGPHRDAMVKRVAEILKISADRVSVKATTTEKLGFTGRGEGIAAQATATVALPVS